MTSPFDFAWALLKAGGWEETGGVDYGDTGEDFETRFPESTPRQDKLAQTSHLGDMRQGKINPNAVDAKMTVEEALEFNRQMAALPKPEPKENEGPNPFGGFRRAGRRGLRVVRPPPAGTSQQMAEAHARNEIPV